MCVCLDKPQAVLSVLPNQTFAGETVTVPCDTGEGEESDWDYYFYKDGRYVQTSKQNYFALQAEAPLNQGFNLGRRKKLF